MLAARVLLIATVVFLLGCLAKTTARADALGSVLIAIQLAVFVFVTRGVWAESEEE